MGVIDTLAAGFQTVARRPLLIALLLLLDLFLWLGPQLSIAPVVDQLGRLYQEAVSAEPTVFDRLNVDAEQRSTWDRQAQDVLDGLKAINLFGLLAWQMPSLIHLGPVTRPGVPDAGQVTIPTVGRLVIASLGLMLVGLVWTSAYNGAIAQYVRGDRFDRSFYFDRLGVNWLRLLGFYALIALAGVVIGLPVLFLAGLLNLIAPALGAVLALVFWSIAAWVVFFLLFFVGDAIFVGDLNPWPAIRSSVSLVQRHFWGSLGLILLIWLIAFGTVLVWNYFRAQPFLFPIALAGNAFISSGLTAASMIFYRDRVKGGAPSQPAAA